MSVFEIQAVENGYTVTLRGMDPFGAAIPRQWVFPDWLCVVKFLEDNKLPPPLSPEELQEIDREVSDAQD